MLLCLRFTPISVSLGLRRKLCWLGTICGELIGDSWLFLQAEGQEISPHVVRKALENTATKVSESPEEPLTTGRGLLQVDLYVLTSKDVFSTTSLAVAPYSLV